MTKGQFTDLIPERDPAVHHRHRREVFWQITFPMVLGGGLLIAVCVLTGIAAGSGADTGLWRDVSLIWLLAPLLILALLPMALFAAAAFGTEKLIRFLPPQFYKVQEFFDALKARAGQAADAVVAPVIRLRSFTAGLRRMGGKRASNRELEP